SCPQAGWPAGARWRMIVRRAFARAGVAAAAAIPFAFPVRSGCTSIRQRNPVMVRSRLACVALGLGLLGGCTCFTRQPLVGRAASPECGCGSGATITEGAVVGDGVPPGFSSANQGMLLAPPPESAPAP